MRDSLWNFNRFSLGKPCQKRILSKRQLSRLIDLNMNPSPQDGFIVAQDRSFLKPQWSGKSGTSRIVSFEHAKASAALAALFKSAYGRSNIRDNRITNSGMSTKTIRCANGVRFGRYCVTSSRKFAGSPQVARHMTQSPRVARLRPQPLPNPRSCHHEARKRYPERREGQMTLPHRRTRSIRLLRSDQDRRLMHPRGSMESRKWWLKTWSGCGAFRSTPDAIRRISQ